MFELTHKEQIRRDMSFDSETTFDIYSPRHSTEKSFDPEQPQNDASPIDLDSSIDDELK